MSDDTLRTLEREAALAPDDPTLAERLEAARRRLETPEQTVERLARAQLASSLWSTGDGTLPPRVVKRLALSVLAVERLPRGWPARLDAILARIHDTPLDVRAPLVAARIEASRVAREEAERKRVVALNQRAALAPRAAGLADVEEALARAQGTARERALSVASVVGAVRSARLFERAGARATTTCNHDVAKSYKYPVTFSYADTYRVEVAGLGLAVLVEIVRTATWGRREDTSASLLVVDADGLFEEES